jgi:putative ABC transport system permease protein
MNNLKLALRKLLKNPGFTAIAVFTLALGIGANTAIFSFVNAILLRPLPYREPDRLVMLFENHITNGYFKVGIGAPVLQEWRRQTTLFEGIGAARAYGNFTLTGKGAPETLRGSSFSANVFSILGIQPLLGRGFLQEEETYGNHLVALLSYEFWQRRFGGDRNIVGQTLTLGGEPHVVVGVMPRGTRSPEGDRDIWTPLAFKPYEIAERHSHNFQVYARMKPGVSLEQARAEMNLVARRMADANPANRGWGAEVHSLHEIVVGNSRQLLLVLLGAVSLVLLIACANIANLLLSRSAARETEFAIRTALGAGRAFLVRQLLVESCVLAGIGGALGVVLARVGLGVLQRTTPMNLPRLSEGIPLDGTALAFAALATLGSGILFGLIPAWQSSNPALSRALAKSARGSSPEHRQSARSVLVVGEVALSLILLVGAGLTIRSFNRLLAQDTGFVPEHLVTMTIGLPEQRYTDQAERVRLFNPLLSNVRSVPGIESAAYAFGAPLTEINSALTVSVRGAPQPAPGESVAAGYAQVSPGYFQTLKTPLLQGRDFTERDDTNAPLVMIVDETFARNFKLGTNVIGQRIDVGDGAENVEIVGLVKDIKRTGLADRARGEMYRPYRQMCWGVLTLVVRTQRNPTEIVSSVRRELDRLDRDIPLENVSTMSQLVSANVVQRRLSVQLLGAFAGAALLLAALGLYGVLAGMVAQRTREIGIRVALGAKRSDVLALVIGQGMRLAIIGIAIGIVGALALGQSLSALLYEIKPRDPVTLAITSLVLLTVAFFACWIPARRATRVDPIEALRYE